MNYPLQQMPDPDDYFSDTRMSFGDHLDDLRTHLLRAVYGFLIGMFLSFFIGSTVMDIIQAPVKDQLEAFWERTTYRREREIIDKLQAGQLKDNTAFIPPYQIDMEKITAEVAKRLKIPYQPPDEPQFTGIGELFDALGLESLLPESVSSRWMLLTGNPRKMFRHQAKMQALIKPASLSTLSVQEAFMVFFKVCLLSGLVISSPWVFMQIWLFVAAGLYPHEKKLVNVYGPVSLFLFLVGVIVCEVFVIPKAIEALLWFNEWLGLQPDLRLNEWMGFAIFMPLVFGLSFQTPLVMMFVERIGVLTVDQYRANRKFAWFGMAIFAAVITPSTDAFSMLFLLVPMSLLYELGIWMCTMGPRSEFDDFEGDNGLTENIEA